MEASDYFPNGAGDTLSPVKNNEKGAIFQVITPEAVAKDIFFVSELESKTDNYGTKLQLVGGGDWEKKGKYFLGKKAAMEYFEKLNPGKNDDYYTNQIKQQK
jgi:hypothetical protein